jgi:hypothetical protein
MELELFFRPTVSRPVSLGIGPPVGILDQILSCSSSFLWQLRLLAINASALTRKRVCNYCTIASRPCQSNHTWAEVPQNSWPYLTVSSETPPTWRARFPYIYPPGTEMPSYTPGHRVPFLSPLTTRGDYGGSILSRPHTGLIITSVSVSVTLQLTVSQSASLGVGPNLGLLTRDIFFLWKLTVLSNLGRPLWREVGSVICQSFVNIVGSSFSIYIQFILCVIHSLQLNTIQNNGMKKLHCVIHIYSNTVCTIYTGLGQSTLCTADYAQVTNNLI